MVVRTRMLPAATVDECMRVQLTHTYTLIYIYKSKKKKVSRYIKEAQKRKSL